MNEVLKEKLLMLLTGVEVMRGQADGEHWHFGFQLHLHQAADDRLGNKIVTVDAAIHDQCGADNAGVTTGLGQQFCVQRDLERAADFEEIARATFARVAYKLPVRCRFVTRRPTI